MDLAETAHNVLPQDMTLLAAVFACLLSGVDRGMEQRLVEPIGVIWEAAAVSPDRWEKINRGADVA